MKCVRGMRSANDGISVSMEWHNVRARPTQNPLHKNKNDNCIS